MILLRQYIGTKNHNWTKDTVAGDILRSNIFGEQLPVPVISFPKICVTETWKNITAVYTIVSGVWKSITDMNIVSAESWKNSID